MLNSDRSLENIVRTILQNCFRWNVLPSRINFITLVLALTLVQSARVAAQGRLVVGVYAFPQTSFLIQKEQHINVTMRATFASGNAFHIRKEFSKHWSFVFGMHYSVQGQKYELKDYRNYKGSIFLRYAKLPLLVHYNYLVRPKYSLFVTGGPQVCMLVQEEGSIPLFNTSIFIDYDLMHPGSAHREFILDGAIGAGIEIKIANELFLTFVARSEYSTRADKNRHYGYYPDGFGVEMHTEIFETIRNTRNLTFATWGGINFGINRKKESSTIN